MHTPSSPTTTGSSFSSSKQSSVLPSPTLSINTKVKLDELLCSFPQWNDPTLVRSLFAPLPSPSVKPEAFQQKYTFWHDILLSAVRNGLLGEARVFSLPSTTQLGPKYFCNSGVGGLYPICLPGILKEMQRRGIALQSLTDLNKTRRQSWLSRLLFGAAEEQEQEQEDDLIESSLPSSLILLPLLNEQRLLLQDLSLHPSAIPLTLDEFKSLINTTRSQREGLAPITNPADWTLLLEYLQLQGVLSFAIQSSNTFAIKLGSKSIINQVDWDIIKLKETSANVNTQVLRLTTLASNLRSQQALERARGDIQAATFTRQRLNRLETFITQRMNSLGNLDALMTKIEGAGDDVAVLAAYRSGSAALQQMLSQMGDVRGVMDELAELNEAIGEVSKEISQQSSKDNNYDDDLSDLERELKDLIVRGEGDRVEGDSVIVKQAEEAIVQEDTSTKKQLQREALLE